MSEPETTGAAESTTPAATTAEPKAEKKAKTSKPKAEKKAAPKKPKAEKKAAPKKAKAAPKKAAPKKAKAAPKKAAPKKAAPKKAAPKKAKAEGNGQRGRTSQFAGMKITKLVKDNPRREGTIGHASFALITSGMKFEKYQELGGSTAQLAFCVEKGYVKVD